MHPIPIQTHELPSAAQSINFASEPGWKKWTAIFQPNAKLPRFTLHTMLLVQGLFFLIYWLHGGFAVVAQTDRDWKRAY